LKAARLFALALFVLAVSSSRIADQNAALLAVVIAGLIAAYNRYLKRWVVAGSLGMAAVRGANMALGAVAVGMMPTRPEFPWIPIAVLAAYVFALTLWSTGEDRGGGRRGFPALVGSALAWAPLSAAIRPAPHRWAALIPSLWILPWVLRAVARPEPVRMMQVVRWGVLGIILLDASFLAALGRWTEAGVVAALILPALALLPVFRRL
jgi:4-hydroxybenzoate polyprenyltransferase